LSLRTTHPSIFAAILAAIVAGCAATAGDKPGNHVITRQSCPRSVLYRASTLAEGGVVLRAARRLLEPNVINSQGRLYRLTPRNAPIDLVARVTAVDSYVDMRFNRLIPGSLVIERAGASECGARTATASWAIHYGMPESVIANTGVYTFLVKTKRGWRFWGDWCAAGQSRAWRRKNCIF
jgi:hypothetical protein